jgi:hypothetical protein
MGAVLRFWWTPTEPNAPDVICGLRYLARPMHHLHGGCKATMRSPAANFLNVEISIATSPVGTARNCSAAMVTLSAPSARICEPMTAAAPFSNVAN